MMRTISAVALLALAGCISYADPASFRAPSSQAERAQYKALLPRAETVSSRIASRNGDLCPRGCELNVRLGVTNGNVGAFFDGKDVRLPLGMIDATQSDDELALVIGHEMGHWLMHHQHGYVAAQELQADCFGTMIAMRSGFDAVQAEKLYIRLGGREDVDRVLMLSIGMAGGGATLPWLTRINAIRHAAAVVGEQGITPQTIEQVCGVRL